MRRSISALSYHIPPRSILPVNKTRICVTGYTTSHNVGRSARLAKAIAKAQPEKYEAWFYFDGKFRGGISKEDGGFLMHASERISFK